MSNTPAQCSEASCMQAHAYKGADSYELIMSLNAHTDICSP